MKWLFPALVVLLSACTEDGARFATQFASNTAPVRPSVSVLGVYKDGRMSSEDWEETLGPRLSPSLGLPSCEAAYGSALLAKNPSLGAAIDDYARADGPGDDLLGLLTPAAKGDFIVVIAVAGRVPPPSAKSTSDGPMSGGTPAIGGRGRGGMGGAGGMGGGGGGMSSPRGREGGRSTLELSASLYSVRERRSVGLIAMQYDGVSFDDAVAKFAQKLTTTLPATTCAGWNWEAAIDPEKIRAAKDR